MLTQRTQTWLILGLTVLILSLTACGGGGGRSPICGQQLNGGP